ncbi:hypothetical protein GLW05_16940 [Pontibacillus yanchengensis]|uniref:Uncharacterized protein n=1 Tax=Pontibacillus yanchengensis TaxID=462910 RepID=A0A6I5A4M0_9BACI|nr:hypothetical protein [Pontibacillus yanchengensis]MYL35266.1 hypothetical protein [Pontibacillus yanchengensis]
MNNKITEIENKILQLEAELSHTKHLLKEVKGNITNNEYPLLVITYFTYTVKLSYLADNPSVSIIGSMVIKNLGDKRLTHPYICLKLNSTSHISFAGKINDHDLIDHGYSPLPTQTWNYINEDVKSLTESEGEYWLSPLNLTHLDGGQTLSFANFQIRLDKNKTARPFKIVGFIYGKEIEEGIATLNKIHIN